MGEDDVEAGASVQRTGLPRESAVQLHSDGSGSGSMRALEGRMSVRRMVPVRVLLEGVTRPVRGVYVPMAHQRVEK